MSKMHECPMCGERFECAPSDAPTQLHDARIDSDVAILRRQVVAQGQAIEALRAEIARDWQRHNGQHEALSRQVDGEHGPDDAEPTLDGDNRVVWHVFTARDGDGIRYGKQCAPPSPAVQFACLQRQLFSLGDKLEALRVDLANLTPQEFGSTAQAEVGRTELPRWAVPTEHHFSGPGPHTITTGAPGTSQRVVIDVNFGTDPPTQPGRGDCRP